MIGHWYTLLLVGQAASAPGGDGGGATGGHAIRARLLREFKDDEERRKERAALADLPQPERSALRAVAEQIAHAPLVTVESVEASITAALADLGQPATAGHLDWTLHFLRVQADAARIAGQALARAMRRDDEEAALMLLLMA